MDVSDPRGGSVCQGLSQSLRLDQTSSKYKFLVLAGDLIGYLLLLAMKVVMLSQ